MNEVRVNICVVGLGHWGPNLVKSLESHSSVTVVCGVESSSERRAILSTRIPGLLLYPSLLEALEAEVIDGVFIATPTHTHYEMVKLALNYGKDVFVEKPLCLTSKEGKDLIQQASQQNQILFVGHVFLYNEAVLEMKRLIHGGELGRLNYLRCTRTNLGPIRSDVNALWDLAPHDISLSNFLFSSRPSHVSCNSHSLVGSELEDISQAQMIYPDGRVSILFVSWLDPLKRREVVAVGDQKMMLFDDMQPDSPLRIFDKGVMRSEAVDFADTFHAFRMSIREGRESVPKITTGQPLRNECHHFIECVLSRSRPRTDGQHGLEVISVLEALDRSAQDLGRLVKVHYEADALP